MRIFALAPDDIAAMLGIALHDDLESADVILLGPRHGPRLREVLPRAKNLKWVHALSAGVETLPLIELAERGVQVTNGAGLYGDALAEFALAGMLWFAKGLRRLDRNQTAKKWEPFYVERLEGKSVGIIGFGGIGKAVARLCEAMRMHVQATRKTSIDDILRTSDYVVLSVPLTNETRGMITRERLQMLRDDAVLINVSRGAVVDERALIEELKRIKGAALDVFETEPLPESSPLWALPNVLICPHSADRTRDSMDRAVAFFLGNLARYERGQALENAVNPSAGY